MEFEKLGWLYKLSGVRKQQWDEFYFVLSSNFLFYFEDKETFEEYLPPKGKIVLDHSQIVKHDAKTRSNAFGIRTGNRSYVLAASSGTIKEAWIAAIKKVALSSSSNTTGGGGSPLMHSQNGANQSSVKSNDRQRGPIYSPFRSDTGGFSYSQSKLSQETNGLSQQQPQASPPSTYSSPRRAQTHQPSPSRKQSGKRNIFTQKDVENLRSQMSSPNRKAEDGYRKLSFQQQHRRASSNDSSSSANTATTSIAEEDSVNANGADTGLSYTVSKRAATRKNLRKATSSNDAASALSDELGPTKGLAITPSPAMLSPETPAESTTSNNSSSSSSSGSNVAYSPESYSSSGRSRYSTNSIEDTQEEKNLAEEEQDFQRFQELSRLKLLGDQAFNQHNSQQSSQESEELLLSIINQALEVDRKNLYLQNMKEQLDGKKRSVSKFKRVVGKVKGYRNEGNFLLAIDTLITVLPDLPSYAHAECLELIKQIEVDESKYDKMKAHYSLAVRRLAMGELDEALKLLDEAESMKPAQCPQAILEAISNQREQVKLLHVAVERIQTERLKVDALFEQRKYKTAIAEYEVLLSGMDKRIRRQFSEYIIDRLNLANTWMNMQHQAEVERLLATKCHEKGQFKMALLHLNEAADLFCRVQVDNWELKLESIQAEIKQIKREKLANLFRQGNRLVYDNDIQAARECYMNCVLREPENLAYQRGLRRTEILLLLAVCPRSEIEKKFPFENQDSCLYCCEPPQDDYPTFSLLYRRHHCRLCFTSACDDHLTKVTYPEGVEDKVYCCYSCASALKLS